MFEAQATEFPFVQSFPKREKSRMQRIWEHFQEVKAAVAEKGMIVPQHLVAELLDVSKQRVCQLLDGGRLESINIGGIRYITERSLVEFAKEERKNGRPLKAVTDNRRLWNASLADGKAIVKDLK